MAVPTGLSLASITIGFISFSITILTLLGVYSSLLSTMRSAPTRIPIVLGNLRQEILAERAYLRQRIAEGRDPFGIFPKMLDGANAGVPPGARGYYRRRSVEQEQEGYAKLLSFTVRDLWMEFRRLERPFLVGSGLRAKAIEKGDYWSENDLVSGGGKGRKRDVEIGEGSGYSTPSGEDEKPGAKRRKNRRRRHRRDKKSRKQVQEEDEIFRGDEEEWELAEGREDLIRKGARFYNTDFSHRFIWWQCESEINSLAEQVQRVQIRRMERDLFETDELVRMLVLERGLGGRNGGGLRGGGGGGSGSGSGDDVVVDRASVARSRAGSRAPSRGRRPSGSGRNLREVDEVERVMRTTARSPRPTSVLRTRQSEGEREANVAARRTGRRRSGPVVEYEVLRPRGDGYVVVNSNYRGTLSPGARVIDEDDLRRSARRRSSRDRD